MKQQKRTCDPGKCCFCQYIGEGCFLCEKHLEIVVDDWVATENFQMCARKKGEKRTVIFAHS